MNKERNFYYELDKLTKILKNGFKRNSKLQEYINYIDKETPNSRKIILKNINKPKNY